jgi:hypothetical protein
MATDTKTLDERIREKAHQQWEQDVKKAFEALDKVIGRVAGINMWDGPKQAIAVPATNRPVTFTNEGGEHTKGRVEVSISWMRRNLEALAIAHGKARAGDAAVAAFLTKVDSLADEVESLRYQTLG